MKILKALFLFTFTILTFTVGSYAQSTWQVQKYDIAATLPQTDSDRFMGSRAVLTIKNVSASAASTLTLRISDKAEVSGVKVNGATNDFTKGEEKVSANKSLQRIVIRMPAVAPGSTVSAEVTYRLKVDENSGLNALSPIGSQFLPLSFWYPTPNSWFFARGADYAPYKIQVTAGNGQTFIASGVESAGAADNKAYGQPFFVAGDWDMVETADQAKKLTSQAFYAYLPKGAGEPEKQRARELLALTKEAQDFAAAILGSQNIPVYRLVGVRRGSGFSDGGTILIDENVFRRQKIDSQTAMTIADAVVKTWFGNTASVSGDAYGVIREGLSRYLATQFFESKYGKEIADLERLRQRTAYAAVSKRDSPLNVVSPIDDYYYAEVANKGAMIWRILAKRLGEKTLTDTLKGSMADGNLNMAELRAAFSSQKAYLDYAIDQITDMNLMVGLPQVAGGETRVALRNTGATEATVNVLATTATGEKLTAQSTVPPTSFGQVSFKTTAKIVRVEIDTDRLYPQIEYLDDVAPREFDESDVLLVVKKRFDKQEYSDAERIARQILQNTPRFDDVRILLARSLLAQNRNADAEQEFRAALDEKLPTARTLAWANVGLGETASRGGRATEAVKFADEAIRADSEYGATLAARALRVKANAASGQDEKIKAYFGQFDKAAASNRKAELEALAVSGESVKFTSGISGQTEQWQTQVLSVDKIDGNTVIVETRLNIKLLGREPESGTAVYRLARVGSTWKLLNVDMFEVR